MSKPGILASINPDHRRIAAGWLNDLSRRAERTAIPPHIFPGLLMWMAGWFVACQRGADAEIIDFVKSIGWHYFRAGAIDGNATRGPDALTVEDAPPSDPIVPRPEVAAFAALMERELRANDERRGRAGLKEMPAAELLRMLDTDAAKLRFALAAGDMAKIVEQCADVAIMAMMIADVHGWGAGQGGRLT